MNCSSYENIHNSMIPDSKRPELIKYLSPFHILWNSFAPPLSLMLSNDKDECFALPWKIIIVIISF